MKFFWFWIWLAASGWNFCSEFSVFLDTVEVKVCSFIQCWNLDLELRPLYVPPGDVRRTSWSIFIHIQICQKLCAFFSDLYLFIPESSGLLPALWLLHDCTAGSFRHSVKSSLFRMSFSKIPKMKQDFCYFFIFSSVYSSFSFQLENKLFLPMIKWFLFKFCTCTMQ